MSKLLFSTYKRPSKLALRSSHLKKKHCLLQMYRNHSPKSIQWRILAFNIMCILLTVCSGKDGGGGIGLFVYVE